MDLTIDPQLSGRQNFHKVVDHAFAERVPMDLYYVHNIFGVGPYAGNDFSNSRALIRGVPGSGIVGETNVYYRRQLLAENQPGAGTRLYITNEITTHEQVLAALMARFKLVLDQLNVTLPRRVPFGGDRQNYTLSPKGDSVLYTGPALTVTVINTSAFVPVTPTALFGNPVALVGGRNVYTLPAISSRSNQPGERITFDLTLDASVNTQSFKFAPTDLVLSNVRFSEDGLWTLVDFEPGSTAKTTTGGTFRYQRREIRYQWFYLPTSYQSFQGAEFFLQGFRYLSMPSEKIVFGTFGLTGAYRRLNFTVPNDSLIFNPGAAHLYMYAL